MTSQKKWWKSAVGYQVYPRSFCDNDGDGIGDVQGIISKLDYLTDLGVGFIWLSPVFKSPMIDNGYDISDYQDIAPEFGTLADIDELISQAANRNIKIVMDLVVNHCSSEHEWFKAAMADSSCPEHDYFIWRKPCADGGAPTDAQSHFGGSMWEYVPKFGAYYFHQFAKEQPDLNWQNPDLRAQIYAMMNWWLDRGIGGFRMDVIDLIGKDVDAGIFAEGPDLHGFLQEMHRETLRGRDVLTVGETWSVTTQTALKYSGKGRDELDMIFHFDHVKAGWHPELGKWSPLPFDLPTFKNSIVKWQEALDEDGWNSLFLSNHDLPRQLSKYGDTGALRVRSAKMLATIMHLMKGTPFIYQGEEIGMTNVAFERMDQFRDIETFGHYNNALASGQTHDEFIVGVNANGRDNARTPMQWSSADNAGFSAGKPWIDVNPNYTEINVEADSTDKGGVSAHYKKLIALRRELPIIVEGYFRAHSKEHNQVFAYERTLDGQRLVVVANFSDKAVTYEVPSELNVDGEALVWNVEPVSSLHRQCTLEPYEAFALMSKQS